MKILELSVEQRYLRLLAMHETYCKVDFFVKCEVEHGNIYILILYIERYRTNYNTHLFLILNIAVVT